MFRCVARVTALAMVSALVFVAAAQAQVQPYGTNDFCCFRNVLPPGTNGFDDATQLAQLRQLFRYQLTQRSDIPFSTISQRHAHIEPQTMVEAAVGAKKLAWRKRDTNR